MDKEHVYIFQSCTAFTGFGDKYRDRHKSINQGVELLFYDLGYSLPFLTVVTHCVS